MVENPPAQKGLKFLIFDLSDFLFTKIPTWTQPLISWYDSGFPGQDYLVISPVIPGPE